MTVQQISKSDLDTIHNSDIPFLIDFYADWCGPCKMVGPMFEKLSDEYEGKVIFAKVNVDNNQDLSAEFDIHGIPCIIMMKKDKEVGRIVGYQMESALKQEIDEMLEKASQ